MIVNNNKKVSQKTTVAVEISRYENLPLLAKLFYLLLVVSGLGLVIFYLFGYIFMWTFSFYFLFMGIFYSAMFLILPARKKDKSLTWFDFTASIIVLGICIYFSLHGEKLTMIGWRNIPLGIVLALLVLEGSRRTGGPAYFITCVILGSYPLYADYMPGILWGRSLSFIQTIDHLLFTYEGLLGIPTKVAAEILVGFLVFTAALLATGAGDFFLKLATGLLGKYRGGPAKVSVLASCFFGSLSGSILSNIAATGSITIPTMKRSGYPAYYAAGIEACASTGGVLMPPVMGALAFVMADFLQMDYVDICIAAAIPAILYYFGLLMQVDAYAAKIGLKGLPQEEIPPLKDTLKQGWPYLIVLVFLIWGLVYMRWERYAPWYATILLFPLSFFSKKTMMTPKKLIKTLEVIGKLICQTVALILPIGFVIGGLVLTGVSGSFSSGIITIGGSNLFTVLIMGVVTCYILGMAGLSIPAYIFLAVTLAPAVVKIADLNLIAVHLFILYYSMLDCITLPVAPGAFLAATMAGAKPMKTALTSMRLGVVIYFIPFFFLYNPALILQGSLIETLFAVVRALFGIILIAGGLEGYLIKVGSIVLWIRPFLIVSGGLIAFPEWNTTIFGVILALFSLLLLKYRVKMLQKIGL